MTAATVIHFETDICNSVHRTCNLTNTFYPDYMLTNKPDKGILPCWDTIGSATEHYRSALTHKRVTQHPVTACVSEWVNRLDFSLLPGLSFSLLVNGQRWEIWTQSMGPRSSYVSWWQSSFIVPPSLWVKLSEVAAVTYTNGQTQSHGLYCAVHLGETWRDMPDCHTVSWQTAREQYWWSVQFEDNSSSFSHLRKSCLHIDVI